MFVPAQPIAFLSPGGPEMIVVLLAALMLFGAKDAPRVLRRLNDWAARTRYALDRLREELLYADLETPPDAGGEESGPRDPLAEPEEPGENGSASPESDRPPEVPPETQAEEETSPPEGGPGHGS